MHEILPSEFLENHITRTDRINRRIRHKSRQELVGTRNSHRLETETSTTGETKGVLNDTADGPGGPALITKL